MAKRMNNLSDLVRGALIESGVSRFEIARRSGVSYSVVHGFAARERDVTLRTAESLLSAVGLGVHLQPVAGNSRKG